MYGTLLIGRTHSDLFKVRFNHKSLTIKNNLVSQLLTSSITKTTCSAVQLFALG